jgi:intracellular sulfur oxidation DsrE/DsrF family protein
MVRRVVSLIRWAPVALRGADPVLEANAYAVAEAVDIVLVLRGVAVELAVTTPEGDPGPDEAGPPQPLSDLDLVALLESGVDVWVSAEDLAVVGLAPADLVRGVRVADEAALAELLRDAEAVVTW